MELGIAGRRAAVAGASAGLGLASARALVAEGVAVAICGRDEDRLDQAASQLRQGGGRVEAIVADVANPESAAAFVSAARDRLGGLDIVVPNAGGPPAGGALDHELAAYRAALDLNLLSTVAMCAEAVPALRAQGWGRVVAITSVSVRQPIPGLALSSTARAGATGYLKTLAAEVARDGVTVNSVQPGSHATDRIAALYGDLEQAARGVPTGSLGRPDDFGAVVAFLCSDAARFITGAAIPVDGGAAKGLQ
ncbi:MAG: SDR family oxidoreductase [Actinobacteria bacterium]|nr:SDR family oxidoreductase [Actinomycetota bacterium]